MALKRFQTVGRPCLFAEGWQPLLRIWKEEFCSVCANLVTFGCFWLFFVVGGYDGMGCFFEGLMHAWGDFFDEAGEAEC